MQDSNEEKDAQELGLLDGLDGSLEEEQIEEEYTENLELSDSEPEEEQEPEQQEEEQVSETDINYETEARKDGWCPKEEWRGDPKLWKPAKKFVEDGQNPLFNEVRRLEKQNKALVNSHNDMFKRVQNMEKISIEKAKQELEAARYQAILEGDPDKVAEYDKKMQDLPQVSDQGAYKEELDPVQELFMDFPELQKENRTLEEEEFALKVKRASEDYYLESRKNNRNPTPEEEVAHIRAEIAKMRQPKRDQHIPTPTATRPRTEIKSREKEDLKQRIRLAQKADPTIKQLAKDAVKIGLYQDENEYYEHAAKLGSI